MSNIEFGYDYFDNPEGQGYRGYSKQGNGDYNSISWYKQALDCKNLGISSAIDVGCAKGYLVEELIKNGINAIGYDVSDYALSFTGNLPCYKHDISTGIKDNADAIIALGVLLYLNEQQLRKVMKSIYESTNEFFLFSSYYENDDQEIEDPFRQITRPYLWWRNEIELSGFEFVSREEFFDVYRKK